MKTNKVARRMKIFFLVIITLLVLIGTIGFASVTYLNRNSRELYENPSHVLVNFNVGGAYFQRARMLMMLAGSTAGIAVVIAVFFKKYISQALARHLEESYKQLAAMEHVTAENSALDKLAHLKIEFLTNIAHEMKTPLTVMGGYARLTQRQIKSQIINEQTYENLKTIFTESQRLSELVDNLLHVSLNKNNTDNYTNVPELLKKVVNLCTLVLEANQNRLKIDIEKNCPNVQISPDLLVQIFLNLVNNANKHVKAGTIRITATRQADMVSFSVWDNGEGVSTDLIGIVFERGVSGDNGTGLGLPICKETVENHNGTIRIDSAPGHGAVVTFTLPVYHGKGE